MTTLFGCWNGCQIYWDGMNAPQFVFPYPPANPQVLGFYQLSGRITEVLTNSEWVLNMAGGIFDVPNLPPHEINMFVQGVQMNMGYVATPAPVPLPNPVSGLATIPLAVWANVSTGRADMFNPATGVQYGPQILAPQPRFHAPVPAANFGVQMNADGFIEGGGITETIVSLGKFCKAGTHIPGFLMALSEVGG